MAKIVKKFHFEGSENDENNPTTNVRTFCSKWSIFRCNSLCVYIEWWIVQVQFNQNCNRFSLIWLIDALNTWWRKIFWMQFNVMSHDGISFSPIVMTMHHNTVSNQESTGEKNGIFVRTWNANRIFDFYINFIWWFVWYTDQQSKDVDTPNFSLIEQEQWQILMQFERHTSPTHSLEPHFCCLIILRRFCQTLASPHLFDSPYSVVGNSFCCANVFPRKNW